jgi:UDP-N-acetyl-D-mannosaminuronate dehydrogenase
MILAGRRLNDNMANYVAGEVASLMTEQAHPREGRARAGAGAHVQGELPGPPQLQGGDVVRELGKYGAKVDVYDPWADAREGEARVRHRAGAQAEGAPLRCVVMAVGTTSSRKLGIRGVRRLSSRRCGLRHQACVQARPDVDGRL